MTQNLFTDFHTFQFPQPQYLGAKYKHLRFIAESLPNNINNVADAFAGSQSVAYFFKQNGFQVYTNDFLTFSHKVGEALIENCNIQISDNDIQILFQKNQDSHYFNLMQELFTDIFFVEEEAKLLDSFRSNIELLELQKQPLAFALINRAITRKVTMGHFAHTSALKYAAKTERIKRNPQSYPTY